MKRSFILLLFCVLCFSVSSQEIEHEAPTLQVGLDRLNFTKGTLDPEIIARIIAEKQSEIKIKIIQNSFLKNIYGSGGTIYNYADNIIKGVVQEPDTDVRTKKIMESTVNLVFVYTFTDFYLKQVTDKNSTELMNLLKLANGYELTNFTGFSEGLRYRQLLESNPPDADVQSKLRSLNFGGLTSKRAIEDEDDHLNKFMSLLIDISSEVVRHNDKLRDLGIMRVSYSTNYDYLNIYRQLNNHLAYESDPLINASNRDLAQKVYKDMVGFMESYTSYIGAIKYITDFKSFKSNSISSSSLPLSTSSTSIGRLTFPINDIKTVIDNLSAIYQSTSQNNQHVNESYIKDIETAIAELTADLDYIKKSKLYLEDSSISVLKRVLIISDILYTLKKEIIPNIESAVKLAPELLDSKDIITDLAKDLYTVLLNNVPSLANLNQDPEPFIQLVSKLYEFDRSKTFAEYTKLISLLDEMFDTGKIKNAFSTINTFVKDYTEITTDSDGNEVLVFNVESFLVKLENLQTDRINRFQFHFTVGMNTTSFINGSIDLNENESISNFSHFSEKIGLKFKIINRGDWLPKSPGETYGSFGYSYVKKSPPKEPVISNWHLLLYGSGILYTVIDSGTNDQFDYPMVGFGTGLTFYNALDFNVSIGIPLLENGGFSKMTDNAFVGFGFDIQIGEYLKEVGKKRRLKKEKELIMGKG